MYIKNVTLRLNNVWNILQALLYYDPMGGENMPALSALLNYIGMYYELALITCNANGLNPN